MAKRLLSLCAVGVGAFLLLSGCDKGGAPAAVASSSTAQSGGSGPSTASTSNEGIQKLVLSNEEWKKRLTPEQYEILREHGTERAFTSKFNEYKEKTGTFVCAGCELPLFSAENKFESGSGWPSFYQPITKPNVVELEDRSYGMVRTEVRCARCEGHLGHVFTDGPAPTGLRYCINGLALKLERK